MDYNVSIPCLYCDQLTLRTIAKQHTCPGCFRRHTEQFGPDWWKFDWHQALLPEYVGYCHDSEKLGQALSIEHDQIDFSVEDGGGSSTEASALPRRVPGSRNALYHPAAGLPTYQACAGPVWRAAARRFGHREAVSGVS